MVVRRRLIAGRYELLEQVGGSSWRAADTELEREVFVRLPARDVGVTTLAHPNIVQVFDQGDEDGEPYAVFEYLSGGSLEQRLAAGPLPEEEARRAAADVTAALAYAHAQGIAHGSLGPASILLGAEGNAKVTGFAGTAAPEEDERALAALLQVLGAPGTGADDADVTAVIQPVAATTSRRPVALIALALLALLGAGVGAAFLATSGGSSADGTTGSVSVPISSGTTSADTEPVSAPPTTTSEQTTKETTTTAPPPPTTTPTPTPTEPPPPTTEPPPVTTQPAPPTEPPPPPTTEPPPPTTEPPSTTAAVTETTG
jgi:serine/threonine-protein kinase